MVLGSSLSVCVFAGADNRSSVLASSILGGGAGATNGASILAGVVVVEVSG